MCKKILSVVLVAMMLCTLFAPVGSAYYQEGFETITNKDTISKKWYRYAAFWNSAGEGGGVSAHYSTLKYLYVFFVLTPLISFELVFSQINCFGMQSELLQSFIISSFIPIECGKGFLPTGKR